MFKFNKKGFTLVELLAVIVVLAIIMIIAIPSVMRTMEKAKISSFKIFSQKVLIKGEEKHQNDIMMNESMSTNPEFPLRLYSFEDLGIKSAGKYRGCVLSITLPPGMVNNGDGPSNGPFGNGVSTMIGAVISNDDYSAFGDFRMIQDLTNNKNHFNEYGPMGRLMPPIPENVIKQSCNMNCFVFPTSDDNGDFGNSDGPMDFWDMEECPLFPEWVMSMEGEYIEPN